MSERDRNNEDREYRRREREDRGFFEQARDWIRGERDEEEDRQQNRDNQNYDRSRPWRGEEGRFASRGARYYDRSESSGQDYSRDYQDPRDYRDQPINRDRNDYARGRRYFGQGYGQSYSQRDPNRDEQGYRGREHFRYSRSGGSTQDDSEFRDHRQDDDYADETRDVRRRGYNGGLSRGRYGDPTNRNQSDWDFDEQMRRTYGSEESGRDFSRRSGRPYPSAGMRSDFGSDYNYENEYGEDRWTDRGRSGTFDYNNRFEGTGRFQRGGGRGSNAGRSSGMGRYGDRDFGESDFIGYEREGAFYQDLDEPYSFEYWEIWMVPGEFTGMGPASYQRSDERIQEEVCERLTRHGRVDASQIEIDVKDGEVTLRGQVHSRDMKRMAEDTAEGVTGVKNVNNEIRVPKRSHDLRSSQEQQWQRARDISSGDYNRDNQDWNTSRQGGQMDTSRYESNRQGMSGSTVETGGSSQVDSTARVTEQQANDTEASIVADGVSPESAKWLELRHDMEVIGKNGKIIGRVKEIRASDFLVDREMARDVYVPMDALDSVGAAAMLKYNDDEIDSQEWEKPDIL